MFAGRHVMIDLETLSTSVTAAFTQVGAVGFYPTEPDRPFEELQLHVTIASNLRAGRTVDPDTLLWWMDDDGAGPDARRAFVAGQRSPRAVELNVALLALHDFCHAGNGRRGMDARTEPAAGVWGHGPTFDVSMVEHAYGAQSLLLPWGHKGGHRTIRDTRTLLEATGLEMGYPEDGGHVAVVDARHQAGVVVRAVQKLLGAG